MCVCKPTVLLNRVLYALLTHLNTLPSSPVVTSLASVACSDSNLDKASDVFPWRRDRKTHLVKNIHQSALYTLVVIRAKC